MSARTGYQRLATTEKTRKGGVNEYQLDDRRFDRPPVEVPYASIALAIFLMLFGIACFIFAWMHVTQQVLGKPQAEYGLSIVGFLTFLPGFYHCRIAYYAWKGSKGYTFDSIPEW